MLNKKKLRKFLIILLLIAIIIGAIILIRNTLARYESNATSEKDVDDSHIERIKKAYPAYFDTYKDIDKLTSFLKSFDNLYCIGRNGQHRYNNMDHSMITSFLAVRHILGELKDKNEIWNVNVEKEYHESATE